MFVCDHQLVYVEMWSCLFSLTLNLNICWSFSHQRGFTQQLAAPDQVPDGDVEVRVAAAPVGDLGEGVSGQDVLGEIPPQLDLDFMQKQNNFRSFFFFF